MSEVDALMLEQIVRRLWSGMRFEVRGRTHDRRVMIGRHANRHHVLLNELTVLNAGIETTGNQVQSVVGSGHVEQDVRILARKPPQLRSEHGNCGKPRHQQAHASARLVTESRKFVQGSANAGERWPEL